MINPTKSTIQIGVFAPQGCSLLSYGTIVEPFRQANQLLGQQKYHLTLIGDIELADAAKGEISAPLFNDSLLTNLQDYDLLIVIAEKIAQLEVPTAIKKALQCYYQQQAGHILTVKAGLWWLLESGIGRQHKMVVHWSLINEFKAYYPELALSHELYQTDPRLSSCAGQLTTLDYLLCYLNQYEEDNLITQISEHLCIDRIRASDERQRLISPSLGGEERQPRLTMAIDLMESNIEEPLTTEQIAERVFISRRQLERLFKRYLNTMPARHYLQIRLKHAQQLLQTSNKSIIQIGLSCGFSSGPHFSSAYKSFYQTTPREERAKYLNLK